MMTFLVAGAACGFLSAATILMVVAHGLWEDWQAERKKRGRWS